MRNAFQELSSQFNVASIKAATIMLQSMSDKIFIFNLREGYTLEDLEVFLNKLKSIHYDEGYGTQYLYGTIWFNDGTWADRGEYDGFEWWQHHACPSVCYMEEEPREEDSWDGDENDKLMLYS